MKRIFKTVYTGVYDGPIVFPDGEAEAVEDIRLENLAAMVAERPFIYTCDMTEYLRRYLPILSDFADTLRSRAR